MGKISIENMVAINTTLEESQARKTMLMEKARREWNEEKKKLIENMKQAFANSIENINKQMEDLKRNIKGEPKKLVDQIAELNKAQQHMILEHQMEMEKLRENHRIHMKKTDENVRNSVKKAVSQTKDKCQNEYNKKVEKITKDLNDANNMVKTLKEKNQEIAKRSKMTPAQIKKLEDTTNLKVQNDKLQDQINELTKNM